MIILCCKSAPFSRLQPVSQDIYIDLSQLSPSATMGAPPHPFHVLDLKGMILESKGTNKSSNGSLRSKVSGGQGLRGRQGKQQGMKKSHKRGNGWSRRNRRVLMKRRGNQASSPTRPMNGIEKRVRILKKLVPYGKSKGLDGLFRVTADYIVCLQTKVRVMQTMVELLSNTDE